MKEYIKKELVIPEGIELEIKGNLISVKSKKGEVKRKLAYPKINIEKKENKLLVYVNGGSKKEKKLINTINAHIKNLVKGVSEGFEYELKICSGHFPMTVSVEGYEVVIKNFIGEKIPRRAKILDGVNVKVDGDQIFVNGYDIEAVSQTASNIEQATRRTGYDKRIFQDGCYITVKDGRKI